MPEKPKIQIQSTPEWFAMGADGVTYGPFATQKLAELIRQGRISEDTRVQHPKYTSSQWELAGKVKAIEKLFHAPSRSSNPPDQKPTNIEAIDKETSKVVGYFDPHFTKFATPWVVKILWATFLILWFASDFAFLLFLALGAFGTLAEGFGGDGRNAIATVLAMIFLIGSYIAYKAVSILLARLTCEGIIVLFDIRNQLILLRQNSPSQSPSSV